MHHSPSLSLYIYMCVCVCVCVCHGYKVYLRPIWPVAEEYFCCSAGTASNKFSSHNPRCCLQGTQLIRDKEVSFFCLKIEENYPWHISSDKSSRTGHPTKSLVRLFSSKWFLFRYNFFMRGIFTVFGTLDQSLNLVIFKDMFSTDSQVNINSKK